MASPSNLSACCSVCKLLNMPQKVGICNPNEQFGLLHVSIGGVHATNIVTMLSSASVAACLLEQVCCIGGSSHVDA